MNWLAHLYLSPPDPAFRIGNLLPDILPPASLDALSRTLPSAFQRGIEQHRRIDSYTDTHPVVRAGIQRLEPAFRRFGGILCDVYYDHFLARYWTDYSSDPLPAFAAGVYESFDHFRPLLPPDATGRLDSIRAADLLSSYQTLPGIAVALARIGSRFRRPVDLAAAMPDFEQHYDSLLAGFRTFFPELHSHVAAYMI